MKGRQGLNSIRRLRCLLLFSDPGRIGVYNAGTIPPAQLRAEGGSSRIDDALRTPCTDLCKDFSSGSVSERILSSFFTTILSSHASLTSTSQPCLPVSLLPASFHSPPHSPSSFGHIFNGSFRVSAVPFATIVRERVPEDEEEEEEEVARQENQEVQVSGNKKQQEEDGRAVVPEEDFTENTGSASEVPTTTGRVGNDHEDELCSREAEARKELGWSELGWTSEEVLNWPNAISTARLLSGPLLAWMIIHELWSTAFLGLVIAGVSDWLDGYVARKMDINSVLGSYLDPVADKFLVGSVAVSMAYTGLLHPALVGLIVARDGVLMSGAFVYRAYSLHWQWKDWREFFRISVGGAGKVEPLFISKVNTVLQLALVGVALLQPALSMEDTYSIVPFLSWSVVATTSMSWIAYAYLYLKNPESLAALRRVARSTRTSQRSI